MFSNLGLDGQPEAGRGGHVEPVHQVSWSLELLYKEVGGTGRLSRVVLQGRSHNRSKIEHAMHNLNTKNTH